MLIRKSGWEHILSDHIKENINTPFIWGQNDCCLFVCDWIFKATGIDPAKDFRNKYKTELGAKRAIRACADDLEGVAEKIATELDMQEAPILMARRGDIALIPGVFGKMLGIVDMTGRNIANTWDTGLNYLPISKAIRTWRVG